MISVLCVMKSGGQFGHDYITSLYECVNEHLSDFKFYCLTDIMEKGLYETFMRDEITYIPLEQGLPAHWSKVEMWRPDLEEELGRCLYIDLSSIVTGDLTDIASYSGKACIVKDFYYGTPSQSVLNWEPGAMRLVWDAFIESPDWWMSRPFRKPDFYDQTLMNHVKGLDFFDFFQELYPGQIVSYKVHCQNGLPPDARIVKFHGSPKPHEVYHKESWIPETLGWGN